MINSIVDVILMGLSGIVLGALGYWASMAALTATFQKIDMHTPLIVSCVVMGILLFWRFDFSLMNFFMLHNENVDNAIKAIDSIFVKLSYILFVFCYFAAGKVTLHTLSR